ncbi:MAG: hypothetical protein A3J27_09435 [Candidatus Tectomicrobia bacterium RIFCSPLOWO2_12_FULL_69_37]|nr:MAG: hypothetical protein A3J27_09435 [Candidatus Tectomicrobia bacterium RIFCSPLOWO2_12_FULL_69_37]
MFTRFPRVSTTCSGRGAGAGAELRAAAWGAFAWARTGAGADSARAFWGGGVDEGRACGCGAEVWSSTPRAMAVPPCG